mgnify:CR=1 FL=1
MRRTPAGAIARDATGKLFFDGVVPLDGPDALAVLQSLEALITHRFQAAITR